jgi:hypothetical protein
MDDFVASWESVEELESAEHLVLDTAGSLDANLESVRSSLPPPNR